MRQLFSQSFVNCRSWVKPKSFSKDIWLHIVAAHNVLFSGHSAKYNSKVQEVPLCEKFQRAWKEGKNDPCAGKNGNAQGTPPRPY